MFSLEMFFSAAAGVCALSVDSDRNFMAYPSSTQTGEVQIFDTMNLVSAQNVVMHVKSVRTL